MRSLMVLEGELLSRRQWLAALALPAFGAGLDTRLAGSARAQDQPAPGRRPSPQPSPRGGE